MMSLERMNIRSSALVCGWSKVADLRQLDTDTTIDDTINIHGLHSLPILYKRSWYPIGDPILTWSCSSSEAVPMGTVWLEGPTTLTF